MSEWTTSRTIAPPRSIVIRYVNQQGQQQSVSLTSTDISEANISYRTFTYTNEEGAIENVDVVVQKLEFKTTSQASVNGAMVAGRLATGQGLPPGNAETRTETTYEYVNSASGPVLVREVALTMITFTELAGGLAVPYYEYYTPSTQLFRAILRTTDYRTVTSSSGDEVTRSETSTWIAYGLTQDGQQSFSEQMKQGQSAGLDPNGWNSYISGAVSTMTALVFQGTEVRPERGRAVISVKPPNETIARDAINAGQGDRKSASGRANFGSDSGATKTKDYTMPFAPDDFLEWVT